MNWTGNIDRNDRLRLDSLIFFSNSVGFDDLLKRGKQISNYIDHLGEISSLFFVRAAFFLLSAPNIMKIMKIGDSDRAIRIKVDSTLFLFLWENHKATKWSRTHAAECKQTTTAVLYELRDRDSAQKISQWTKLSVSFNDYSIQFVRKGKKCVVAFSRS